ncbi:MAG: DUF1499 domain-containing protein [Pseudomonadota bacterium]
MKTVLIGIVVLVVLGVGLFFFLGQKSQGGASPGLVDGRLMECPSSPNCVSSEDGTPEEKTVEPLPLSAWAQLPAVIADMGGVVTTQEDGYLAAEFTSKTFKFVDDLEFRLTEDAVHVRSASRVGYSDRGVNGARVATLREKLSP